MVYTTNWFPNPSFEYFYSNVTALPGTEAVRDNFNPFSGAFALHVFTNGAEAGQGVEFSPTILSTSTGSLSFYVAAYLPVTLLCQAWSVHSGLLQQQTVVASQGWQRIVFNNLSFSAGDGVYGVVITNAAILSEFYVDAIQVETDPIAHAYIDGDKPGVVWSGTPGNSTSVQAAEFGTSASGAGLSGGHAGFIVEGEVFKTTAEGSTVLVTGECIPTNTPPFSAFTDFAIAELTDPDPAMTYTSWNNAGTSSGHTSYTRVYGMFYPPLDYPNSTATNTWNRAAFAAVGFQWASIGAGQAQDFTDVQLEFVHINGVTQPTPSSYDTPRAIHTIIHPDRLNYITNPSFEVSTVSWSAVATGSIARDTTKAAPVGVEIDEVNETAGSASLKVTINATGDGAQIQIADLIIGETYTVSCYIQAGPGIADIQLACSGGFGDIIGSGYPYGGTATTGYGGGPYGGEIGTLSSGEDYGFGSYGSGLYGGASPNDLPTTTWFRPYATFTASDALVTLQITAISSDDVVYPANFWVDAVLCEAGSLVGSYFDGGWGTDYFWEGQISNGSVITAPNPGISRSYYYNQYYVKSQAVLNVLAKHTPLGLNYVTPVYTQPYTQ